MKKEYTAPLAEIQLFAPVESVASWKIGESHDDWWFKNGGFTWGITDVGSAPTTQYIYDADDAEFHFPTSSN